MKGKRQERRRREEESGKGERQEGRRGVEKAEIIRKKNSEILQSLRFSSKGALCGHACVHTCVREVKEGFSRRVGR